MKKETVIILHGILRSDKHMRRLASYIEAHGYKVLNINYPSTKYDLVQLSEIVWSQVGNELSNHKLHFIGYSMGGLLARVIINKYNPSNLGKVIFIGTPNKGSIVADILSSNILYRKILGPAGQQLISDQNGFKDIFGEVNYEVGSIAGTLGIYLSSLLFKETNDGVVSLESTKLKDMKDHIALSCPHFYLPYSYKVHQYAVSFLSTGQFVTLNSS